MSALAEAEQLAPAWSALLERSARNELTVSPDWMLTWWRVYGGLQGRRLRVGLFHEGERLIGLAPLLWRRHWYGGALPFRRLEFLASGEPAADGIYSNHLTVLAERGAEEQVARCFVRAVIEGAFGAWDEVVLPMMSGDTALPDLLVDGFRDGGVWAAKMETASAPYIPLPSTWEAYLRSLSRSARRIVQRSMRAFDAWAGGAPRLEVATNLGDLETGKRILVGLHHGRWAEAGKPGVFHSPLYLQFHDAIMPLLARRGSLELAWLCARGEPVAALYGMSWAGKVHAYQTGRRTDLPNNVRPGFVLFALAIRRAIEAGQQEFDLLADDAPYKRQLAPRSRPLVQVRAARRSLVERVRRGAKGLVAALRSFRGR